MLVEKILVYRALSLFVILYKLERRYKVVGKYKVITLCGSTKFKNEFIQVEKELTLKGNIVISVGLFGHADGEFETLITTEVKIMLDDMHKRKIDMADEIFVINKGRYIGESTKGEIEYAIKSGKRVNYLEPVNF